MKIKITPIAFYNVKPWVSNLPLKERWRLVSALRECADEEKNGASRKIVGNADLAVYHNPTCDAALSGKSLITRKDFHDFFRNVHSYSAGFLSNLSEVSEIIGYCCDEPGDALFFEDFYYRMADVLNKIPEDAEEMHLRMSNFGVELELA